MAKKRSRANVVEGVKFIRKKNGQFNGSIGLGKQPTKVKRKSGVKNISSQINTIRDVALERGRLRRELNKEQRKRLDNLMQGKPASAPEAPKFTAQIKQLKAEVSALKKEFKARQKAGEVIPTVDSLKLKFLSRQLEAATQQKANFKELGQDSKTMRAARALQKKILNGKKSYDNLTTSEVKLLQLVAKEERAKVDRAEVKADSWKVLGNRVKIWESSEHAQYKKTKFRRRKEYDYIVGGESLNRNKGVMIHKGETVLGVPDNVRYNRNLGNDQLIGELATTMRYVENHDAGVKAPAPYWHKHTWGAVDDESKMGKPGNYGQAQLHHINQWAKTPLDSINKRYESGEITLEQAKAEMRDNLNVTPKGTYELKAADRAERAYVVLPGGLHDLTSPYYYDLNHPKGIHPDTGELTKFGLPDYGKTGSEYGLTVGREYHNGVRDSYWGEWHRQNAHAIVGEVNRRIRKGELTPEEFNTIMELKTKRASR